MPDGEHQRQSRATERALLQTVIGCGVHGREQPTSLFAHVLPPAVLAADRPDRVGIVADGLLAVPEGFPRVRGQPRQRQAALAEQLFDVKNIHDGTYHYTHRDPRRQGVRCTAVIRRAAEVHREYELRAMHLDAEHHGVVLVRAGPQRMLQPQGGPGPVQQVLQRYGQVHGCAFGPRAEASGAVPALLSYAAMRRAEHDWRGMGARSVTEAISFQYVHLLRSFSIRVQSAEAQLRIRRARALQSSARRPGVRLGVRYAEDAEHGDFVGDMAGEFLRGLHADAGGHDRR